jgi:hypothetical protein
MEFLSGIALHGWCGTATGVMMTGLFAIKLSRFTSFDHTPDVEPFVPKKGVGMLATLVDVGFFIKNFSSFDIIGNNFVLEGTIWFEFNPTALPVDTVSNFSFRRGTIVYKSLPEMILIGNRLLARYDLIVKFSTSLDHRLFPLDDRRIFLVLTNNFVSPDELIYNIKNSDFRIAPGIFTGGLKQVDKHTTYGTLVAALAKNDDKKQIRTPAVMVALDFAKGGIRRLLIIVVPLMMVFLLGIFGLTLNPVKHESTVIRLTMGALTALLGYRFVIEKMVPDVGYSTFTDHFYNILLVAVLLIFILSVYAIHTGLLVPTTIIVALYGLVNGALYYFLFRWEKE